MKIQWLWFCCLASIFCLQLSAYQIEAGDAFIGGGFGANVNVVRYNVADKASPKGDMPMLISVDHALDPNLGLFGTFMPQFSAGSVAFSFHIGVKYWLSSLKAPYVPYVSLALTPSVLMPVEKGVNHYSIGLAPGLGINFFVMADFLVGAGVRFNPSIAVIGEDSKFELSTMGFFDVTFKM